MADSIKKYLDMVALETLVDQIKAEDTKTLSAAKTYADGLGKNYDAVGAAATAKAEAIADADAKLAKKVDKVEGKDLIATSEIERLAGITNYDDTQIKADIAAKADAATMTTELGKKVDKKEGYSLVSDTEIARLANVDNYNDTEVRGLINDNADGIKALSDKIGTVPADQTVMGIITNIQESAYDDTEIQGKIDDVSGKVTTLIGDDANKSVRTIANEELAKQLIAEGAAESLDTLAEIAAWIQSHPGDAAAMNQAITALQNKVDTGDKTVSAYVTDAINALNIGDYAKAADLTALADRVAALENKPFDTYATKTEVENVDKKFANYTTTTDMNTALDKKADKTQVAADIENAVKNLATTEAVDKKLADYTKTADLDTTLGLTTKLANKADKSVVDAMYTNDKIDELVEGAKTHATGLNSAMNTRVEALEGHFEGETNVLTRLTAVEASANANATAIAKFTAITADEVNALFA